MMTETKSQPSYKALSAELESIIEELQVSNLDVDRVLAQYERGVQLISKLEKYLSEAENRVKVITTKPTKAKR